MLDLADNADLTPLAMLVRDLRSSAPGADVLLVGAMARDVLLQHASGVDTRRQTKDVDIALLVDDWAAFHRLRGLLLDSGQFLSETPVLHKLHYAPLGIQIDLIPFGGVENATHEIEWPPDNVEVIRVIGYRDAHASAINVSLPLLQSINVVALPMLVLLKLFAWRERHYTAPRKDAIDIETVLKNYLSQHNLERLSDVAPQHFTSATYVYEHALSGAWLCGRDARRLLDAKSPQMREIVISANDVLDAEANADGALVLVGQAASTSPEGLRLMLGAFRAGLNGKETP